MKKITLLLVFNILVLFSLTAQHTVTGKIIDENNQPLEFVVVTVTQNDSTIKEDVAKDGGIFTLNLPTGNFNLQVIYFGKIILNKAITVSNNTNLGELKATVGSLTLGEFVLEDTKNLIERKVDRLVFNVENTIAGNSSGNALEILSKTPMVKVNTQNISIIGKSEAKVMVNGRLSVLSGEDLINFLSNISSQEIAKIEVITNPSSRYDAEGNGGLINIVTKENKEIGTNGSVNAGYIQSFFPTSEFGGSINHREKKINLFGNVNYRFGKNRPIERLDIYNQNQETHQVDVRERKSKNISSTIGFDYNLNKNNLFGFLYSFSKNNIDITDNVINENSSNYNVSIDSIINTSAFTNLDLFTHSFNLNYNHDFDSLGKSLSMDADYLVYTNDRNRDFDSHTNLVTNGNDINLIGITNNSNQQINLGSFKMDLDYPTKFINLSLGGKISLIENKNENEVHNEVYGVLVKDTLQSNNFVYKENTEALYFSGYKTTKKIEVQFGLRGEKTDIEGNSVTLKSTTKTNYFKIFPSFNFLYKVSENNAISATYNQRINRPNYSNLNPFRFYITPKIYAEGNPFLRPSYTHNVEIGYTFKNTYSVNLFYQKENDYSSQAPFVDSLGNLSYLQSNIGFIDSYGIYTMLPFKIRKFWEGNLTLYYFNYKVISQLDYLNTVEQQVYSANISNQFYFGKNNRFSGELSAYIMPPGMREGITKLGTSSIVNIGVKTSLIDKVLFLTVNLNDIFHLSSPETETVSNNIVIKTRNQYDTRNIKISLVYRFGNRSLNSKRQRDVGNNDEKTRI